MKEIITFHIGQAGVQSGSALWELLCAEHNVTPSGDIVDDQLKYEHLSTLFQPVSPKKWVPRSLFVDLEPSVVDEIRIGSFRALFHPDRLISGPEDAANNFARGFFTIGKLILAKTNEHCRRLFEQSDGVQGMLFLRSLCGGTGSGLTAALFEGISDYSKTTKIEIPIYPSPTLSTSMVEPYNCLLGEHFCMEDIDVGILLDNEAMFEICLRYLSLNYPTYNTINRMIAQVISSVTSSARFLNIINCDLNVLQTNLIPYPRIHFPLCNFAPILNHERASHQELSVQELTKLVFDRENQMLKVDHFYGKFMTCALFYRGRISPHHIYLALTEIKKNKNIEFVDWCPNGFKVGISAVCPVTIPDSKFAESKQNVAMLTNTSAISQAWQRLTHRFYLLYSKRSFVHWFIGEGMEECEFSESLYNLSVLVKDYEEAGEKTIIAENESGSDKPTTSLVKEKLKDSESLTDKAIIENLSKNMSDSSSKQTIKDSPGIRIKSTTTSTNEKLISSKSNEQSSFQFTSLRGKENESGKEENNMPQKNQSSSILNTVLPFQEIFPSNNINLFSKNQHGNDKISKVIDIRQEDLSWIKKKWIPNSDRRPAILNPKRIKTQTLLLRTRPHHFDTIYRTSYNTIPANIIYASKNDKLKLLKLKYRNLNNQKRKIPMDDVPNGLKTFLLSKNSTYSTEYDVVCTPGLTLHEKSNEVIRCKENYFSTVLNSVCPGASSTTKDKTSNLSSNEKVPNSNTVSTESNLSTNLDIPPNPFNYTSSTKDRVDSNIVCDNQNFTKISNMNIPFSYAYSNGNLDLSKYKFCNSTVSCTGKTWNHNFVNYPFKDSLKHNSLSSYDEVSKFDSTENSFLTTDLSKSNVWNFGSSFVERIPLETEENNIQTCSSSIEISRNPYLLSTEISSIKSAKTSSKPISNNSLLNLDRIVFASQSLNDVKLNPKELNTTPDSMKSSTSPSLGNSDNHHFVNEQREVEKCSMNVLQNGNRSLSKCLEKKHEKNHQETPILMHQNPQMSYIVTRNLEEPLKNLFHQEQFRESFQCSSKKFDFIKMVSTPVDNSYKVNDRLHWDLNQGFSKENYFFDSRPNQQEHSRRTICSNNSKGTRFGSSIIKHLSSHSSSNNSPIDNDHYLLPSASQVIINKLNSCKSCRR